MACQLTRRKPYNIWARQFSRTQRLAEMAMSNLPSARSDSPVAFGDTLTQIGYQPAIRHNPRSVEPTVWPCVVKLSGILCRHPYSDHVRLQRRSKRAAFTTFPGRVGVTCFAAVRPSRCACRFSCVSVKYTCHRVARIREYCVVVADR